MNVTNKQIAVLGFGTEGQSAVKWFLNRGAKISVLDEKKSKEEVYEVFSDYEKLGVQYIFGKFDKLALYDLIVFSQGIRIDRTQIVNAKEKGILVTTPTNIFMESNPAPVVGVTGTKGKGTTSALIYEMLKFSGQDAFLGGNIGTPPLDFLDLLTKNSIVVLELSSFQLFSITKSPYVSVILMVTSEHLDYHKDSREYVIAKSGIVKYQGLDDMTVVNCDYPNSLEVAEISANEPVLVSTREMLESGCFIKDGSIIWKKGEVSERIIDLADIFIPGAHNWENAVAAVAAAKILEVPTITINQILKTFKGLPHRLEFVKLVNGVKYYDDSFSTTPETAIAAIRAFEAPKVLILGGSSKNSFRELGKVISGSKSIRGVIGIGVEWPKIKFKIHSSKFKIVENCKNMTEIVEAAKSIAQPGDVVMLSPACASFDMFKNYKDRGEQFKQYVNAL